MKVGIQLMQSRRELAAAAPLLERLAVIDDEFDLVAVVDHHGRTFDDVFLNPLIFLTHLGARTRHLELTQGIMLPLFYPPVLLAEQVLTMSELTGGRLSLGLGVGWQRDEFATFGVPYAGRTARFEEYVRLLRHLLSDRSERFDSELYDYHGPGLADEVSSRWPVTIFIAGIAGEALARVARVGDGWFPSHWVNAAALGPAIATLTEHWRACRDGRPAVRVSRLLVVDDTEDAALAEASRILADYGGRRRAYGHPIFGQDETRLADPQVVRQLGLVGTREQVLDQVQALGQLGVTDVILRPAMENMTPASVVRNFEAARWLSAQVRAERASTDKEGVGR